MDYSPASVTFYFLHWTEHQCLRILRKWVNQQGQKSCLILSQTRSEQLVKTSLTGLPTQKEHQGSCIVELV